MLYFVQAILEIFFMILCIITNPFVCLFADEYGNLPIIFKLWQTEDNCLDVRWMIYEDGCTPKIIHYDYDKHYSYHYEHTDKGILYPGYVDIIDKDFTAVENIKRYFCRLCWLYRNCNYGFSYYINGRSYNGSDNIIVRSGNDGEKETWISYIRGGNIITKTWAFYIVRPWCKYFALRIYLGWKLKNDTEPYNMRAMIAAHFNPFRPRW